MLSASPGGGTWQKARSDLLSNLASILPTRTRNECIRKTPKGLFLYRSDYMQSLKFAILNA